MIKTKDVIRFSELKLMLDDARQTLNKLEAEKKELEKRLIEAVNAGQRVEGTCPFKLQVEIYEKRYTPAYKQCAIGLAGESAVNEWVAANNPHEKAEKLGLIPKAVNAVRMSKPVRAVMEALRAAAG